MLDRIISPTQIAFIPGRLITNNIIVVFEVLHYIKTKQKGSLGCMTLKLDMSKTYDRVESSFLDGMMRRMRFCDKWRMLIMSCVTYVSFSVMLNGRPSPKFSSS